MRLNMIWRSFMLTLALLAITLPAAAQDDHRVTDEILANLETFIQENMAVTGVPGAAVAVVEDGEIVYAQGFGVRNVDTGEPVTAETLFRAGSITKSMTSMMIAQLVDEGFLDWDTPVSEIWPGFDALVPQVDATIHVRDLMGMDTGLINNGLDSLHWGEWTVDDLFAALGRMEVGGDLGQFYAYNNEVYATAAYVAAAAAGEDPSRESYIGLMQSRVFDPLQMDATVITDEPADLGANYATSYGFTLAGGLETPREVLTAPIGVTAPAGAVWSNALDMAAYAITQLNGGVTADGTRVVSEASLSETWQGQVDLGSGMPGLPIEGTQYGMGWVSQTYAGIPVRYHDGGWEGHRALLTLFPEDHIAIVVLTNHILGDMLHTSLTFAFAEQIYDLEPVAAAIFQELLENSTTQIDSVQQQLPPAQVDEADVAEYLGDYADGWALELHDDQTLWVTRPGWEIMLHPLMPGMYMTASDQLIGAMVNFAVDADGTVTATLDLETEQLVLEKLP